MNPQAAAEEYRNKIINPIKESLPEAVIQSITEQLSGACTTEIAAFDEFTGLLTNTEITEQFDHIILIPHQRGIPSVYYNSRVHGVILLVTILMARHV